MTAVSPQADDKRLLRFELEDADDYSRYILQSRTEILYLLRTLLKTGSLMTVYFNAGNDFFLTALLDIDEATGKLFFDFGSDDEMNRKALAAEKLVFITMLERVRIQFSLPGVERGTFNGRACFTGGIPDKMLRLQRREYFRLTAPVSKPLKCSVTLPDSDRRIELNVLDISGGGLAVVIPPSGVDFEVEQIFPNCRVELPEVGNIMASLKVCSLFDVTLRNGAHVRRSGCQFMDLPGPMLTMIQRYITRMERERKARETGMA